MLPKNTTDQFFPSCAQFYGTINSLYKALAEPLTAFVFPCAVYSWVYRTPSARNGAVLKPWKYAPTLVQSIFTCLST